MQPQQPYNQPAPVTPVEQTPYDFIMNAGNAPKATGPNSMKQRLIIVGGLFGLLLILGLIMISVLSGGGNSDVLLRVQQVQAETTRVSQLTIDDAGSQTVRNAAINTKLATTTDQQLLGEILAARGVIFEPEQLLLGQNPDVAGAFEEAQAAGTLDSTALTYLQEQVAIYEATLAEAYQEANSPELQAELNRSYAASQLLRKQLDSTNL